MNSAQKIGTFRTEVGLSQIMIAINPGAFNDTETADRIIEEVEADIKASTSTVEGGEICYPGEHVIQTHRETGERNPCDRRTLE